MADASKTEQATPRHRKKAREQGRVTRSRELSGAMSMFAVAGALAFISRGGASHWTDLFRNTLDSASTDTIETNGPLLFWTGLEVLRWVVPIQLCALIVSLAVGLAQGGFIFAPEALQFKIERLSPVGKMKQIFSPAGLSNLLKSLLPFAAIVWIGVANLRSHWDQILGSSYAEPRAFASLVGGMVMELCWKSGLVLLIWAGADYQLIWLKNEGDLKMSKQEIRDEMKESEGNPQNKSRMRKMARAMRRKQMIKATETATVVITNPTHYAVALKFEINMTAPVVVAKGLDLLAVKIKEIAYDRGIAVIENRALAQALYKGVEVGDVIPSTLYHAVAEILVLVYKAQEDVKRRDAQRRATANLSGAMVSR